MRGLRSVFPLFLVAAFMVVWLSVRFWFGDAHAVWMFSCMLGAWAPIFAAAAFLYVLSFAVRNDHVAVAWVVRALGMHFVLVWMLGFSDWLRGPPHLPPAVNPDLLAPVVLLGFFPPFALAMGGLKWFQAVGRRLNDPMLRPAMPGEMGDGVVPFRGVPLASVMREQPGVPVMSLLVGAASIAAVSMLPSESWWVLAASALALALCVARNPRALVPGAIAQVAVTAAALTRGGVPDTHVLVSRAFVWPWASLVAAALYLGAVESLLRARARRPATG